MVILLKELRQVLLKNRYREFSKLSCQIGKLPRYLPTYNNEITKTSDIRKSFLDFFQQNDHKYIPPRSVLAQKSGSYFVNAGVNQFLSQIEDPGSEIYRLKNVVNSQRCIRLGGKDCDWNNVGYDPIHLSCFEMLGNWSFGDYGKEKACTLMWKYITEVLGLPKSHLYVSYFGGDPEFGIPEDEETRDIWMNLGVKDNKILQFGREHNFWESGDRKRGDIYCGPSTEIHWDYLATAGSSKPENVRCARCFVNSASPEVVELWNCVFMQYKWNHADAKMEKLPSMIIDTGMGLERLATVTQGVSAIYDTDNFSILMDQIKLIGGSSIPSYKGLFDVAKLVPSPSSELQNRISKENIQLSQKELAVDTAYRIVADHMRAVCVAISDGILPGRQEQQKRVRQLLYRAVRMGYRYLNCQASLYRMTDPIFHTLEGQIDVDKNTRNKIKQFIQMEEIKLLKTIIKHDKAFEKFLQNRDSSDTVLTANELTRLTQGKYGIMINLNALESITKEVGLSLPEPSYQESNYLYNEDISHTHVSSAVGKIDTVEFDPPADLETDCSPVYKYQYDSDKGLYITEDLQTQVKGLVTGEDKGRQVWGVVTASTNMFPIRGGQSCDIGTLVNDSGHTFDVFKVTHHSSDPTKPHLKHVVHWLDIVSDLTINSDDTARLFLWTRKPDGAKVTLRVDNVHRTKVTVHHTAQHLVRGVLEEVLGGINVMSSAANGKSARIMFSVNTKDGISIGKLPENFLQKVENRCNEIIEKAKSTTIDTNNTDGEGCVRDLGCFTMEQVNQDSSIWTNNLQANIVSSQIRVIQLGTLFKEVCCGTHAHHLSHLHYLLIGGAEGLSSNNRIELTILSGLPALLMRTRELELLDYCGILDRNQFLHKLDARNMLKALKNAKKTKETSSKLTRDRIKEVLHKFNRKSVDIDRTFTSLCEKQRENPDTIINMIELVKIKNVISMLIARPQKGIRILHDNDNTILIALPDSISEQVRTVFLERIRSDFPFAHIYSPRVQNANMEFHPNKFIVVGFEFTHLNQHVSDRSNSNVSNSGPTFSSVLEQLRWVVDDSFHE